jgi:DUF4097 and DUF4098 domain-containing protein YvlB
LKDCFDGKISSDCLSRDLNGSSKRISNSSFEIHIERIKLDSEFEVKRTHIEKILTETINGNLTFDNLRSIASQLMFSDYFHLEHQQ